MKRVVGTMTRGIIALLLAVHLGGVGLASASNERLLVASSSLKQSENAAPDFELRDLEGKSFQLSQFRGERPVLIYFWATWCPHCVASRSDIARLREAVSPAELEILGINVAAGDSLERVKRFQKGHPTAWPILYDAEETVAQRYAVQGIPLYVLVNKEGDIVYRGHELPDPRQYLQ